MSSSKSVVYKLKDICTKIGSGSTPKGGSSVYEDEGVTFIRSQNVYNNQFVNEGLVCLNAESAYKLRSVEVIENDILLNITGDSVARCTIVPSNVLPARVNQHVCIIRADTSMVDYAYLKYFLVNPKMQLYMLSIAYGGGTRAALTKRMIENFEIKLPSLEEQKKISALLLSIDNKIESNNEMNKTLEEMSQTLFKRWFVDFEFPNENGESYKSSGGEMVESELGMIPKGWRILTLDDLCVKITDGSHFSPKHCETGLYPMLSVKDMRDYGFDYQSCKKIDEDDYKKMINSDCIPKINDILVAKDGSYLKHIFITNEEREEAILSSIAIFRPNTNVIYSEILLNMLKQPLLQKKVKENYVSGSALPRIVLKDFKKLQVIVPTMCIQNNIIQVFKAYRRQILINTNQNESLISLRDSLLPKLMSGEIRVEDIEANL
ncbi:restriction endonuclease subunit S [Clostridium tertium]|jgi:type I restriction enzyme, S subunit|uniref:restriction endonuclease subunit S n=1 Tax=Clostridium tertium TaxID=1559 RepID=UPI0035203319